MYRILIADDEGLMLEAFKGIILAEFGEKCIVETAKTGRVVIEKAETFHPDSVDSRILCLWTFTCRESTESRR